MSQKNPPGADVLVWWILWFSVLAGMIVMYQFLPATGGPSSVQVRYLPLIPLSIGVFIRWALFPRASYTGKALPLFVVGLAMNDACGILGILLVPEMRQTYFLLALFGVFQYVPFFASRSGR